MQAPQKVVPLKITAFTKAARSGSGEEFSFLVSPESMNSQHRNKFSPKKGINTSGRNADFSVAETKEIALKLSIDNTLVRDKLQGGTRASTDSVKTQVDKFLQYCYYMDGEIHEPRFLLLEWGKFFFKCRLKSVDVAYAIFNNQGEPLRATLDVVFLEDMPDDMRLRLENKQSPDITHVRTVLQGQTLTGLCKEIYGSALYYRKIASANSLDHFRSLKPGSKLYFPPLAELPE